MVVVPPLPTWLADARDRDERLAELRREYFEDNADLEYIAGAVSQIDPSLARGYYDGELDVEEFIASLA